MHWKSFNETELTMGNHLGKNHAALYINLVSYIFLNFKVTPLSVLGMTVVVNTS